MSSALDNQAAASGRWLAALLGRYVDEVENQAVSSLTPEVRAQRGLIFPSSRQLSPYRSIPAFHN